MKIEREKNIHYIVLGGYSEWGGGEYFEKLELV